MKKILWTLNIGNYAPEITKLTFPFMEAYAHKIGAEFRVMTERKFPDYPITYEKFQLWELTKQFTADWHLYFDSDALIHPEFFDVTALLDKSITCSWGTDFVPVRFRPDKYFLRDGRFIGKGNWCAIFSDWCRDYFFPLEEGEDPRELTENVFPTLAEAVSGMPREQFIDDYLTSRNISRFGLKHVILREIYAKKGLPDFYLYHEYMHKPEKKAALLSQKLQQWGIKVPA